VLDHRLRNEAARVDALVQGRAPQGIADVAGEIVVCVTFIAHATVLASEVGGVVTAA
jgi:hypothetical protein